MDIYIYRYHDLTISTKSNSYIVNTNCNSLLFFEHQYRVRKFFGYKLLNNCSSDYKTSIFLSEN